MRTLEELRRTVQRSARLGELTPVEVGIIAEAVAADHGDAKWFNDEFKKPALLRVLVLFKDGWLNDEGVNMYFQRLHERDVNLHARTGRVSSYWSSLLFSQLRDKTTSPTIVYLSTNNSIREKKSFFDIKLTDKIFIPVNKGNSHWYLCVVYVSEKVIRRYDSDCTPTEEEANSGDICSDILSWLAEDLLVRARESLDVSEWRFERPECPQQENGLDCGVYTCMFANYLSEDLELDFCASDVPHFRRLMASQLLQRQVW